MGYRSPVIGYVRRTLLAGIAVALGVSMLTFSLLHLLPGDPVLVMLGDAEYSSERVAELRADLGLDDPVAVQYARYLGNLLRGDLGRSVRSNRPVVEEIRQQIPNTLALTFAGLGLAAVLGVPLGALAAYQRGGWLDRASVAVSLLGVSFPSFWLGMLLIYVFALWLGWLPATGQGGPERLILPALTLGVQGMAVIALVTRAKTREVLAQAYLMTARAIGTPEARLLRRDALKNVMIPVVTILGLQFAALLGGSVIIENVFARQGMGRLAVDAIFARDVPVVQGVVLVTSAAYVLVNLLVDLVCAALDPRIRYG
jgi:ABC-type dipeptide/oligopeptide/nickel transport system permease component